MSRTKSILKVAALSAISFAQAALGQPIIGDEFNVAANGTGFALGTGVNAGINPPATRLTGTQASNLRYILTGTVKPDTAYSIAGNKLRVTAASDPGRFTLSADGINPFDFSTSLGSRIATPQNPVTYDLSIRMANNSSGTQRFSFAIGTRENDATFWDFGIQVYRTTSTDDFYTIGKRIDAGASGLGSDLNSFVTHTRPGTYGTEIGILMRVTDAGEESSTFGSQVRLSLDEGLTWVYDSAADPDLPNGWRLPGMSRYIMWDVAPGAGPVTYDSFLLRRVPISAVLISPQAGASNIGASPTLSAAVSNTTPGDMTVTFHGREAPGPSAGADFVIAVLPDTQNYAREAAGNGDAVKEMWFSQTEWIVTNRVSQNIAYVAHLGDVVQNGDIKNGSPNTTEWRNATNAMYRLENPGRTLLPQGIPYGLAAGNHDQEPIGEPDGATDHFNQYFGVSHFNGKPYYGGHYGNNNDSHFDLFSVSGLDFLVLYFEFGRYGSGVMDWAKAVLSTNQTRRVIVVTHYAGGDGTPSNLSPQGSAIYEALKDNTNFFLMLGGHVFDNDGESSRSNIYEGRTMRTFISNYQGRMNGGNGYMRLMYFSSSNNTVSIKTYSPWLKTYETDADSQMSFGYDMATPGSPGSVGTPYAPLGTNSGVAPGSVTRCVWSGLQSNKQYEWYVGVTDAAGNTYTSPASTFTTLNLPPSATNRLVTLIGDEPTALVLTATDGNGDVLTFRTNTATLNGLVTAFDTNQGILTYLPARGYRGSDRFTYQASDGTASSQVATVALNVTAPADSDDNGLPDAWEAGYGITEPDDDPDGDGQSNEAEYGANTNPTNAMSALRIIEAAWLPIGHFGLSWASTGGTRYRVQFTDGDAHSGFTNSFTDVIRELALEMDPSPYGFASTQFFSDASSQIGALTNNARYYRIQVVP